MLSMTAVFMLSHNISRPPRRVGHAGLAGERRNLLLAVALGARSAWSMAMAVVASQVEHVSITVV
jgi:hypothetical protein